jgi:DNA-directed RNA polymerase alpha subunit
MSEVGELAGRLPADQQITSLPGLTWHVTKPLREEGFAVVGDLATWSDDELMLVPWFGPRRLEALKQALTEAGT